MDETSTRGKKPNKKGKSHAGRGHIPGRVDISERPAIVEEKVRIGDWEADTIVGKGHSGALVSLVDRAAKYTLLGRVDDERGGVLYLDPTAGFRRDPGTQSPQTTARNSQTTVVWRKPSRHNSSSPNLIIPGNAD